MSLRQNVWLRARATSTPIRARRWLSTSTLDERLAKPVQCYTSTSQDPYLNLSIEHYMLQKSSPESAILFLYVNRPSIIIGRNQNPWLEVNLALLNEAHDARHGLGVVDLVRRRSGGGTVFHDEGNVNWTVISPSATFTRDKHAEMVVRALRSRGVERARVNARHDIVLDQGERSSEAITDDTHSTPYTIHGETIARPLKVSGSAYKLTRGRALHHGTCLLSSPNLKVIPNYLHSPAKPYIAARGVESVSSPVGNIGLNNDEFSTVVHEVFAQMYTGSTKTPLEEVGDELMEVKAIREGCAELKSQEWTYLQTPQFTLSNASDEAAETHFELTVRHGVITEGRVCDRAHQSTKLHAVNFEDGVLGKKLHEVEDWNSLLETALHEDSRRSKLVEWLEQMLPRPAR